MKEALEKVNTLQQEHQDYNYNNLCKHTCHPWRKVHGSLGNSRFAGFHLDRPTQTWG